MLPGEDERRRARKDCLTAGGIALISMAAVAGVIAYSIFTVLFLIKVPCNVVA